jgi:anti-anti-sigma factor
VSENSNGISVGSTEREVFVRVVGRGTFQNSQPLRRFAEDMIEGGHYREFVMDLAECQGMDSTFLGVLAGIGLRLAKDGQTGKVHIVNANARNVESLKILGLDRLLDIATAALDSAQHPVPAGFQFLPGTDLTQLLSLDRDAMAEAMLEAHTDLIRTDERNEQKFRDVTKSLRERIERPAGEKKSG